MSGLPVFWRKSTIAHPGVQGLAQFRNLFREVGARHRIHRFPFQGLAAASWREYRGMAPPEDVLVSNPQPAAPIGWL